MNLTPAIVGLMVVGDEAVNPTKVDMIPFGGTEKRKLKF
jgi:hypothetical protein